MPNWTIVAEGVFFFPPSGPSLTSERTIRAEQQRTGLAFSGSIQADVGAWPPVEALEGILEWVTFKVPSNPEIPRSLVRVRAAFQIGNTAFTALKISEF